MDNDIILAAVAYYNNSSKELKERVWGFFNSVDINRDRLVSFDEFVHFLHLGGYNRVIDPSIFTLLDVHRDGGLEFSEFLTFYYILQTCHRHVLCSNCGADTPAGLYFTCIDCFDDGKTTFDLCVTCYNGKTFWHCHGPDRILHTYALLRHKRVDSHVTDSNMGLGYQGPLFQAQPNHQYMGFSYQQSVNSPGNFQHFSPFLNQVARPVCLNQVPTTNPGASSGGCCSQHFSPFLNQVARPVCLNQVPTTNPGASSGGCCSQHFSPCLNQVAPPVCLNQVPTTNHGGCCSQHFSPFFNQVAPPVCLNQVPTTNPGASGSGSNNYESMPLAVVAYKPPLSKAEKRLEVAKKAGKAVVHGATVVGAWAAVLAVLI